MVACRVSLLLHLPPVDASFKVTVEPIQTLLGPVIGNTEGFTLIVIELTHAIEEM